MIIVSKEELIKLLKVLPDETERIYEKEITSIAMTGWRTDFKHWAEAVLSLPDKTPCSDVKQLLKLTGLGHDNHLDEWVNQLMEEPRSEDKAEEKVYFAAFCIRITRLRRNQDRTQEYETIKKYWERFKDHPFLNHLYSMCLLDLDPVGKSKKILELAQKNVDQMHQNAGVQHFLSFAAAKIFEDTEFQADLRPDPIWLEIGAQAVEDALELDPGYAKFHCTRGRILALQGKYNQALREISRAIDMEDSSLSDYPLRIGNYRMYYQRIQNKQRSEAMLNVVRSQISEAQKLTLKMESSMQEMQEKQLQLEEDNRSSLTKNMEFLGLFAGIVSFTIGGVGIAGAMAEYSLVGAAGLIVVLMGALLGVFAGFGIIIHGCRGPENRRNLIVLTLSAAMILLGVILCSI